MKIVLYISLGINLILILLIGYKLYLKYYQRPEQQKQIPSGQAPIQYSENRVEYLKNLPCDSGSIIFTGNSFIQNFELAELFQNLKVKNRGIAADFTVGVLNRIGPDLACHPSKIFIETGINDLLFDAEPELVINYYKEILKKIKSESPAIKIYILCVFPTGVLSCFDKQPLIQKIQFLNSSLKSLCALEGITFVDTYQQFEHNGVLKPEFDCGDGLHLNARGYLLWRDLLRKYVDE